VVFAADLQAALSVNNLQVLERRAGKGVRYLRSLETDLAAFSSVTGSPVEHAAKTAILRAGNALGGATAVLLIRQRLGLLKNTAFAAQTLMLASDSARTSFVCHGRLQRPCSAKVCAVPERYESTFDRGSRLCQIPRQQQPKSLRYSLDAAARKDTFDVPLTECDGTSESN